MQTMKGVVFDLGGVIALDVWEHLLPSRDNAGGIRDAFGLDSDEVHAVGKRLWGEFSHRPVSAGTTWRDLERQYWDRFILDLWGACPPAGACADAFIAMTGKYIRLVDPDMPALLRALQSSGIKLALCSNNNEFWFRRQFQGLELRKYFPPRHVILSCRAGVSKSSGGYEMFRAAAEALDVEPRQCVFIDDRVENTLRATEFGMNAVRFRGLPGLKRSLRNLSVMPA